MSERVSCSGQSRRFFFVARCAACTRTPDGTRQLPVEVKNGQFPRPSSATTPPCRRKRLLHHWRLRFMAHAPHAGLPPNEVEGGHRHAPATCVYREAEASTLQPHAQWTYQRLRKLQVVCARQPHAQWLTYQRLRKLRVVCARHRVHRKTCECANTP